MKPVALAAALVEFDSRNPSLVPGAPGEARVAQFLGETLSGWGFAVELVPVVDGRSNLIARVGRPGGRRIMVNGHLDVVGVDGMIHPPFQAAQRDGRLYGRGSADMKGGVAAMCVAAREAAERGIDGEIVIACVIDEEYTSLGTQALLASGLRVDAAIVTEPTALAICPAHRGFVWADLEILGRAAHGSRYDTGIDAITHAARVVSALDDMQRDEFPARRHPLLGRGSLHAAVVQGGSSYSIYPDRCTVTLERRTIPGEDEATFRDEIARACERVRRIEPALDVRMTVPNTRGPSDVPTDAPIVQALDSALQAEAMPVRIKGMSAWTDAALLNEAGIPAICFGPGDITLAHAAEEYIPVQQIDDAARVLRRLLVDWCNTPHGTPHASRAVTS